MYTFCTFPLFQSSLCSVLWKTTSRGQYAHTMHRPTTSITSINSNDDEPVCAELHSIYIIHLRQQVYPHQLDEDETQFSNLREGMTRFFTLYQENTHLCQRISWLLMLKPTAWSYYYGMDKIYLVVSEGLRQCDQWSAEKVAPDILIFF